MAAASRRLLSLALLGALGSVYAAGCKSDAAAARSESSAMSPSGPPSSSAAPPAPSAPTPRTKVTAEAAAMGTRLNFVALTSERVDEPKARAAILRAVDEIRRPHALR